jgi:Bax protein
MPIRALGKALGGRRRGMGQRRRPLAQTLLVIAIAAWSQYALAERVREDTLPPLHRIDGVDLKKQRFFAYLAPLVAAENARIRAQRRLLLAWAERVQAGEPLDWVERGHLGWLAREYRIETGGRSTSELIDVLLRRVDVIPESLALAQAAKESAWGGSRFARRGNNLFGERCHRPGCGLVPAKRPAGARFEVRAFDSVRESVAAYLRNLNTHAAYRDFRALRAELRAQGRPLTGVELAMRLQAYSARGPAYVRELQSLIRENALETQAPSLPALGK